jgi:hypothetical protein
MNNLVDHAIKDHRYTREYVMKPEMQEKIKPKLENLENTSLLPEVSCQC